MGILNLHRWCREKAEIDSHVGLRDGESAAGGRVFRKEISLSRSSALHNLDPQVGAWTLAVMQTPP